MRRPSPSLVIALLPLLLLPACWLWWWAGGLNPGVQPGRAPALLLLVGCLLGCLAQRWPVAAVPLLAALGWQAVALLWAPVTEPGVVWLVERTAALATALGLAAWIGVRDVRWAAACAGAGVLALTALTQTAAWEVLRLGYEAPFGLVNFSVGAAGPLVAIGLYACCHRGGAWRWLFALVAAGLLTLLAGGVLGGDPCRSAWLAGGTAIIAALVLRLPARWHAPVLAALGLALCGLWLAATMGYGDPGALGAGSAHRVHLWRAAAEAVAGPALLIGHGPAASLVEMSAQPASAAAWLTVPSWPEHTHSEPLQVLLDGGLVLAALLAWGLWRTLLPLWRARAEPDAGALLTAWICAASLALVESHLMQPGGLLLLAVLAGLTWARTGTVDLPARPQWWPLAAALALAVLIGRELAGDGGGPTSIVARASAPEGAEATVGLDHVDRLRARVGHLDDLDLQRARLLGRLGRHAEAAEALAAQLDRLPVLPGALALARRMRTGGVGSPQLAAAEARARARAASVLATVPPNAVNGAVREALAAELIVVP